MEPVQFKEANTTIGPPEGYTEEEVGKLPAFIGPDETGCPVIVSCWQLSPDEITNIINTGQLWCVVVGHSVPPMSFHTVKPFNQ